MRPGGALSPMEWGFDPSSTTLHLASPWLVALDLVFNQLFFSRRGGLRK
jgi:hypothetical protein